MTDKEISAYIEREAIQPRKLGPEELSLERDITCQVRMPGPPQKAASNRTEKIQISLPEVRRNLHDGLGKRIVSLSKNMGIAGKQAINRHTDCRICIFV